MFFFNQGNIVQNVQSTSVQNNTANLIPYENNALGIKTQYPENWSKHESKDSIRFLSPPESALDNHTEQLKISSYAPGSVPFFQSKKTSLPLLTNNTIDYLSKNKKDFELLNSQAAIANGKSGHMLEYLYTSEAGTTKSLALFIPYSGKVFFISYFADPDRYPKLLPLITNVINSTDFGNFGHDDNKKSNDDGNSENTHVKKTSDDKKSSDSKDDQGPIDEEISPTE